MIEKKGLNLENYRPCVGMMIINSHQKVFIARRKDIPPQAAYAWQMPQGGMEMFETPYQAALRELQEEVGTDKVNLIIISHNWFFYDFPQTLRKKPWKGRFIGQRQKWCLFQFTGKDKDINIDTTHPEFSEWKWVEKEQVLQVVVPFKRQVYGQVLSEFSSFL